MTPRGQAVWQLLRAYLAWVPGPKTVRLPSKPGLAASDEVRRTRCETCGGAGRILDGKRGPIPCKTSGKHAHHGCRLCLVCDGHGWRRRRKNEHGDDEYRIPGETELQEDSHRRDDHRRRNEQLLHRIDSDQKQRAGTESRDRLTDAVDRSDKLAAMFSFRELERALAWLADCEPLAHHLVWSALIYSPFGEPLPAVVPVLETVCELLASRMPDEIRAPGGTDERAAKESLHRGRTERHAERRAERREEIQRQLDGGSTTGEVARRYGLSEQWVRRLRAPVATAVA